ncbi:hypothetical protein AB0Q97_43785, partial [Streptomyces sp. NPDC088135]
VRGAPRPAGALRVGGAAGAGTYAYRRRRPRDRRPDDEERPGASSGEEERPGDEERFGRSPDGEERPGDRPGDQQHSRSRHVAKAGAES